MTGEQALKELAFIERDAYDLSAPLARRLNSFYTKLAILLTDEEVIDVR